MDVHEAQPDDGDDGFFQFGSSVGVNDELRRSTEAEKAEIDQACNILQSNIDLEVKLDKGDMGDRQRRILEMEGFLRSRKEVSERLEVNTGALQNLLSTLQQALSTSDMYVSRSNDREESTIFDGSSDEGSFLTTSPRPEDESFRRMKLFSETAKKKIIGICRQMNVTQKKVAEQAEVIKQLNAEANKLETSIANEGLEEALEKSRISTASKRQMLEDVKRRGTVLQGSISDSEDRMSKLQQEIEALNAEMVQKQKETADKMAEGESLRYAEMQEEARLQETLKHLQVHNQETQDDIEVLQKKDEALHAFIAEKEAKISKCESIRSKRKELFERKVQKEQAILEVKRRIEQQKKLVSSNVEKLEAAEKEKQQNDEAAPLALRAKSELTDVLKEKDAINAVLAQIRKPSEHTSLEKEMARLDELRLRSESRKKEVERTRNNLDEKEKSISKEKEESKANTENLRILATESADALKSERGRFERLKTRCAKRDQAFRKLQILRIGAQRMKEFYATQRELRNKLEEM